MKILFVEDIAKADIIAEKTEQHVPSSCCGIAERLQVHQLPEWRIEEVDDGQDKIPGAMYVFSHAGRKVNG